MLTVQQPWAWAIIDGGKTIENRKQLWSYRGPLAIHAGRTWSVAADGNATMLEAAQSDDRIRHAVHGGFLQRSWFTTSAVIGVVDLVDCHVADGCCAPWGEPGGDTRTTHLVLANPRPVAPIQCPGQLGLWTAPEHVVMRLRTVGAIA